MQFSLHIYLFWGCYFVHAYVPHPCVQTPISLPVPGTGASGIIPQDYLLDQSQPGCEKGGLLNGETVAGKGVGRASCLWAPRVCPGGFLLVLDVGGEGQGAKTLS